VPDLLVAGAGGDGADRAATKADLDRIAAVTSQATEWVVS
jgi:hypothetical protein